MINPETSDPNDPETNLWWLWIPFFLVLFFIFMAMVFARDSWYESGTSVLNALRQA